MDMLSIRKLSGLTQAAFSEKYGIPKRSIENWEAGKRQAPEYVLNLLERAVKEDRKRKYQVNYTDYDNGAQSAIDVIEAPAGYTAEQYIADCRKNADEEWCEQFEHGEVELVAIED